MTTQSNFKSFSLWAFKAWRLFWFKAFDYKSRTTRSEFWCAFALNIVISLFLGLSFFIHGNVLAFFVIMMIWAFALVIPNISISIRRLRDSGNSTAWALVFPLGRMTSVFPDSVELILDIAFTLLGIYVLWLFTRPSVHSEAE